MKSNGLLKWLMIPVVLLVAYIAMKTMSGSHKPSAAHDAQGGVGGLTALEMKTLGIEGDTPHDTVATLVGQVKQLRGELKSALADNAQQRAENDRLRARETAIDQRVRDTLNNERDHSREDREHLNAQQQETQSLLQDLQHRLDGLGNRSDRTELPIGLGLEDGDGGSLSGAAESWIEPQDVKPPRVNSTDPRPRSLPSSSTLEPSSSFAVAAEPSAIRPPGTQESAREQDPNFTHVLEAGAGASGTRPVYSVPSNATLMGSVAMTALVGRVPIDGSVTDPYPFKVLIGPDNLTANGIEIPDVAGAVMSGTASGDWTLSCVRGRIRSMTFVFTDGTVRTVPSSAADRLTASTGESANTPENSLGWLSDPYGIPCVSGVRRSNAQQYLTSQTLITAAGAGAASLIPSGTQNFSYISGGANGNALGTVGITGNEAMGRILAGGVEQMSQWVNKLYGQAFAAVYVPPGARVAVHIEQPINIDYETHGRKVRYDSGGVHVSQLD